MVLLNCVKLYKHIYFYTYKECKSQTIYMQTLVQTFKFNVQKP
jgi:hypothetical protein